MDYRSLRGVVCASICPMRDDGTVDMAGVRRLTRYLVDSGINCLYPNGTNGESLSLTRDERRDIIKIVNDENAGKAVLYNQCGAGTVAESYDHVRFSAQLGVDGVGLMTPVFFQMDGEAMRRYYEDILPEVPALPVYAYNIPARSGNDRQRQPGDGLRFVRWRRLGIRPQRRISEVPCCAIRCIEPWRY